MRKLIVENIWINSEIKGVESFHLYTPQNNEVFSGSDILIKGVIIGKNKPFDSIIVSHGDKTLLAPEIYGSETLIYKDRRRAVVGWQSGSIQVDVGRNSPGYKQLFPDIPWSVKSGFGKRINIPLPIGQRQILDLYINVNNEKIKLASIVIVSQSNDLIKSKTSPILVTSTGRSGSSLLMNYLKNSHHINVAGDFPYETKYAQRVIASLNDFADHGSLYEPEDRSLYQLTKNILPIAMASIESFYAPKPFYAEKSYPCMFQAWFKELYPNFTEIFLVRDFRDVLLSIDSFNKKRGFNDWEQADSLEDYAEVFNKNYALKMCAGYHHATNKIMIKYEDLVLDPIQTLSYLFNRIGLNYSQSVIENIVEKNAIVSKHVTSASVDESVYRWKKEMNNECLERVNTILSESLELFGY